MDDRTSQLKPYDRRAARQPSRPTTRIAIDSDQLMATAYQLFLSRRYVAAEHLCRRLIALDRAYWWCHSLRAAALAAIGRFDAALDAVDRGLLYEQGQPKLLRLRTQILAAIGATFVSRRGPGVVGIRRPGCER